MKILIATMKMDIGGAETHILELCRELAKRSHDVTVVSAGGRLVAELEAAGVRHIKIPFDKKNVVSVVSSRIKINKLLDEEKFDIVHAHARIPAFICAGACRKRDVRFVTTAHFMFSTKFIWRKLSRWGEHTFAVSEDIMYYLRRYRIETQNITVVPNGIDSAKFTRDETLGADVRKSLGATEKKIVLHVSRLDANSSFCARKLLETADKIAEKRSDLMFVFVGGGSLQSELADVGAKINKRHGRRVVFFAGAQSDVRPYLSSADVFVGPSRAALEAMSASLPTVIAGSEGHIGELTRDNFDFAISTNLCCRSAEATDAGKLERDIFKMLALTDGEREELLSLQNELLTNYTVGRMTDIYEKEYKRIAAIKTKTPPRAVICGYYGYDNAGDRAMLCSTVLAIRRLIPDASLCVMSARPRKTGYEYIVGSINKYNVFAVRKKLKEAGVLIFGSGNLLQDQTSRRSLAYYLFILKTARDLGVKTLIYSNGIGPLDIESVRKVVPYLKGAASVSMREKGSYEFCVSHDIGARLSADPAFMLKIGFTPKKRGGYFLVAPKKTDKKKFDVLCGLIENISEKYKLKPVITAMYSAEDAAYCRRLAKKTGALMIEKGITDYGILYTTLCGAEFVISARLHALICACSAHCPMISVGNSKGTALMKDLKLGYCAADSYENVGTALDKLMKNADAVRASLAQTEAEMRALAEKDVESITEFIK
ncbi:MAG: glycosyltransferase [Clostridia bacterium]|nr:glycosyltransferase [Clostridia bacterium]